jgi:hypothetical protein
MNLKLLGKSVYDAPKSLVFAAPGRSSTSATGTTTYFVFQVSGVTQSLRLIALLLLRKERCDRGHSISPYDGGARLPTGGMLSVRLNAGPIAIDRCRFADRMA